MMRLATHYDREGHGGRDFWRQALEEFVAGVWAEFGMLHGEPWPPVEPASLSFFLSRAGV